MLNSSSLELLGTSLYRTRRTPVNHRERHTEFQLRNMSENIPTPWEFDRVGFFLKILRIVNFVFPVTAKQPGKHASTPGLCNDGEESAIAAFFSSCPGEVLVPPLKAWEFISLQG
ncbi:hypothetical protein AVEN_229981-1 [Araneus ventricosus]|uniref:Uncharacterized protein n=1 Tax=Araneus ventricosus TaxID=182803 RepID=A0A4Y2BXA1_ARAVE|nr:hypothetical protein AVEN_229981-1 [Araneus ventricosus]